MIKRLFIVLSAIVICLPYAVRAADDVQKSQDEQVLKEARLPTTGDGLCDYFRQQTPREADLKRVPELIRQLGSEDFEQRQQASQKLIGMGTSVLPLLQKEKNNSDLEVRSRVRECIAKLKNVPSAHAAAAAARMLRHSHPKEAIEVLLDYLPHAQSEEVADEVVMTLFELGAKKGKVDERLAKAFESTSVPRRAAACLALARWGDKEQKKLAQEALKDKEPMVRFRAAQGLLAAGDKTAVPVLLDLLTDAPVRVARKSEQLLQRAAGDAEAGVASFGDDPRARKQSRVAWEAWWKSHGDRLDLSRVQVAAAELAPARVARESVRKYLTRKDNSELGKFLDDKINVWALQVMTRKELVEAVNTIQTPVGDTTVQTIRSVKLNEAVDLQDALTRSFAESFSKEKVEAVYADILQSGQPQKMVYVVRVKGGKALIAGIAPAK